MSSELQPNVADADDLETPIDQATIRALIVANNF